MLLFVFSALGLSKQKDCDHDGLAYILGVLVGGQ